jgi:hypothetical protein
MIRIAGRGGRIVNVAAAAVSLLAASFALGGCAVVRNALGTHDSACFRALPVADGAVREAGRFAGLKYTTVGDLEDALRRAPGGVVVAPPGALDVSRGTGVCVVAFLAPHGPFQEGAVLDGWAPTGTTEGHFAIVVVRQSDLRVLATVVIEHEPIGFVRTFPRL